MVIIFDVEDELEDDDVEEEEEEEEGDRVVPDDPVALDPDDVAGVAVVAAQCALTANTTLLQGWPPALLQVTLNTTWPAGVSKTPGPLLILVM